MRIVWFSMKRSHCFQSPQCLIYLRSHSSVHPMALMQFMTDRRIQPSTHFNGRWDCSANGAFVSSLISRSNHSLLWHRFLGLLGRTRRGSDNLYNTHSLYGWSETVNIFFQKHIIIIIIKIDMLEIVRFIKSRAICPYTISYQAYLMSHRNLKHKIINNIMELSTHKINNK